jgi:drug/metabolite transporter (DMT)-like permease
VHLIRPRTHLIPALIAISFASLFNALLGAVVKYSSDGLHVEAMVFWRNLVCLVLLLPWLMLASPQKSFAEKIKTKQLFMQIIRALSGLSSVFLFFLSLQYLSLSDATLLANTIPIFIPITAYFWKKIPIIHRLWWGIGVAFVGIIVIIQPGFGVFDPAAFIGLAGSICGSIAVFALRQAHYSEPSERTLFYYFLIAALVAGLITCAHFSDNWLDLTKDQILVLMGLGCLGMAYQICFTFAAKWAPVRLTSSFMYLSVVFSMLLQWTIWKQPVALSSILGFILVFIGAILVVFLYPKEAL